MNSTATTVALLNRAPMGRFSFFTMLPAVVCGALLNSLVVYITLAKVKEGAYRWLVLNMALADSSFLLILAHRLFLDRFGGESFYGTTACTIYRILGIAGPGAMFYSLVLLPFNRYIAICRDRYYAAICTPWNMLLACLFFDSLTYVLQLPILLVSDRVFVSDCGWAMQCLPCIGFAALLMLATLAATCTFNFLVYYRLHKHAQTIGSQFGDERARENREVCNLMIAHAAMPILTVVPQAFRAFTFVIPIIDSQLIAWIATYVGLPVLFFNPATDALCTLLILKPYRRAVRDILGIGKAEKSIAAAENQRNRLPATRNVSHTRH